VSATELSDGALKAAQKRARDLKAEFPMLQVKVYDAVEKKLLESSPTE
jgi:hypothetical protein